MKRTEPPRVPKKYAGQWIAWNRDRTKIIASGRDLSQVTSRAHGAGETQPVFAKVPASGLLAGSYRR